MDNSEEYLYDDYYDYKDNQFFIPNRFCGDRLWVEEKFGLFNNSSPVIPIFSWCFQHAILAEIPVLFFLLSLPALFIQWKSGRGIGSPLPYDNLASMKHGLTCILVGDKLFILFLSFYEWIWLRESVPLVEFCYPLLQSLTLIGIFWASEKCRIRGLVGPGIVFALGCCLWSLEYPNSTPGLSWAPIPDCKRDRFLSLLSLSGLVSYTLSTICTSLFSGSVPQRLSKNESPEFYVSFINRQFFFWFDQLVSRGNKKPVGMKLGKRESQLICAEKRLSANITVVTPLQLGMMECKWRSKQTGLETTVAYSKQHNHDNGGGYVQLVGQIDYKKLYLHNLLGSNDSLKPKKDNGKNQNAELPSIIATLFSLFKWQLIGATIVKLCSDLLSFANPLLLSELIAYIENPNAAWWYGYGIALGLFIASELRSIFLNNYFLIMNSAGVEIQSVLTAAVYAKTLKLSNAARQGRTVGEIVNLMAIDSSADWSGPIFAVPNNWLVSAWRPGNYGSFDPVQFVRVYYVKRWQVKQMLLKDERLKMTNEVLNGIRVIKLRKEVELIQRASLVRIFTEVLNISSPFLVAIVTFTFVCVADLFSQLRMPMIIVAELIGQTIQTIVSNRRLKSFMVEEEMDESAVERDFDPEYERAIDVEFASFDWRGDRELEACPPPPPSLCSAAHSPTLHTQQHPIARKTSLLCALLGEMHKIHGYVGVRGTLAYCPQQSWIQNRSVRANIIFSIDNNGLEGSQDWDYDVALYNRVLDACSLRQDLDVLPDGDLTEIGEKGINLSADVYLLDDPLSAVDAIVGKHLFNKAIGPNSMLAEDNQIKKMGTYSELLEDPQAANSIVYLEQTESTRSSTETEMAENADMESEPSSEGTSIKSRKKSMASNKSRKKSSQKPTETIKMIKDERAETGRVKFGVYMQYFKAMKGYMFGGFMLFIVLNSLFNVLNSFWLSDWSDDNTAFSDPSKSVPLVNDWLFGKEFDIIDLRLGVLVVIIISTPLFILIDIPITIIYILILRYFISTSRQLQRLTSITRSPLYATFTETIQGVTSVRAYGVTAKFFDEFCKKASYKLS
uniref:ABC transmembrane type-1 domain-containing protein n=1 Tax=Ditylenchus dipsaci TaxID=166011 RepID=A0A915E4K3_9BILA